MKNRKGTYRIELQDGHFREVHVLKHPEYPCSCESQGNTVYRTKKQVKEDNEYKIIEDDPHYLWCPGVGSIRGETELFEIYRGLRNPIICLKYDKYVSPGKCKESKT